MLHNWRHVDRFTTLEDTDAERQELLDIVEKVPEDDPMRKRLEEYAQVLEGNPDVEQDGKVEFMRNMVERVLAPDTEHFEALPLDEEDLSWRAGQIIAEQRVRRR